MLQAVMATRSSSVRASRTRSASTSSPPWLRASIRLGFLRMSTVWLRSWDQKKTWRTCHRSDFPQHQCANVAISLLFFRACCRLVSFLQLISMHAQHLRQTAGAIKLDIFCQCITLSLYRSGTHSARHTKSLGQNDRLEL